METHCVLKWVVNLKAGNLSIILKISQNSKFSFKKYNPGIHSYIHVFRGWNSFLYS